MSRLPAHLDPFNLPKSRLAKCPVEGCEGGLVSEPLGHRVTITCTELGCTFHETHGPQGLIQIQPDEKKDKKGKAERRQPSVFKSLPSMSGRRTQEPASTPPTQEAPSSEERPMSTQKTSCRVNGCDCEVKVKGLCNMHYMRYFACGKPDMDRWVAAGGPPPKEWRGLHEPEAGQTAAPDDEAMACSVSGCVQAGTHAHQLCDMHHDRWLGCGQPDIEAWRRSFGPTSTVWFELHPPEKQAAGKVVDEQVATPARGAEFISRSEVMRREHEARSAASLGAELERERSPEPSSVMEAVKLAGRQPIRATLRFGGVPFIFETNDIDVMVDFAMKMQKRLLAEVVTPPN